MVQYEKLGEIIKESGMSKKHIAEHLGLSSNGLRKKLDGRSEFDISETQKLCELLRITKSDLLRIFFA